MQKQFTKNDTDYINSILDSAHEKYKGWASWSIYSDNIIGIIGTNNIQDFLDNPGGYLFQRTLMEKFHPIKLPVYKKIIDFSYSKNIPILELLDENKYGKPLFTNYIYLDLIIYGMKKNYFPENHDFYKYFKNTFSENKTKFQSLLKISTYLPDNEEKFNCLLNLLNRYSKIKPKFSDDEQIEFKSIFDKFSEFPIYKEKLLEHQNFYPSLLKFEQFAEYQENDFLSKRFCFDFSNRIPTLETQIENSLTYIYCNIFDSLLEKQILDDYYHLVEDKIFYLYAFSSSSENLSKLSKSVKSFHKEIQPYLQDNNQEHFFYEKMFDMISLSNKLNESKK